MNETDNRYIINGVSYYKKYYTLVANRWLIRHSDGKLIKEIN